MSMRQRSRRRDQFLGSFEADPGLWSLSSFWQLNRIQRDAQQDVTTLVEHGDMARRRSARPAHRSLGDPKCPTPQRMSRVSNGHPLIETIT
jgi:hypothetical protein